MGRNDRCPCGSGKKYKNCCIDKGVKEKSKFKLTKKIYERDFLPVYGVEKGFVVCGKINVHTIAAQKYIAPQAA
ncbi:SEC-C metal-binding domain-containing protein [Jeotgalibaca sp. YN-L-12]|nr:SEC-C metal-binding domain-containing protein [Jeotgalibaca caeni]MDE1548510.1 SEC-C metal-binding domain-containing protein [Jeotgalibaca caeni]